MFNRVLNPKNRIWEIDFLRGILILLVVLDHFFYDAQVMGSAFTSTFGKWIYQRSQDYYIVGNFLGNMRATIRYSCVMLFVFISGMSSQFSHNNLKRGLLLSAVAVLFSLIVYLVEIFNIFNIEPIWFNVIHVLAVCILVYTLVEFLWKKCKLDWQKNLFLIVVGVITLLMIVVGEYFVLFNFKGEPIWCLLFPSGASLWKQITPGDYLSLFPALGWFLLGAAISKKLYSEKKTLFPSIKYKYVAPVCFIGKHTLLVYFGSQVLMFGLVYLFATF